jgi:hypothetical protein
LIDPINTLVYLRDEVEAIDHPALGKVDLLSAIDRAIARASRDKLEVIVTNWEDSEDGGNAA